MKYARIFIIISLALLLIIPIKAQPADFKYRRPIIINNTANPNTLTDYQVYLSIYEPYWYPGMDRIFAHSNGKDIRFYDENRNKIPYWLTRWRPWTWSGQKFFNAWVKVPYIPGSGKTTIYMYYGNPDAESESSPKDTMHIYDDFEDEKINASLWQIWNESRKDFINETQGAIRFYGWGARYRNDMGVQSSFTLSRGYEITVTGGISTYAEGGGEFSSYKTVGRGQDLPSEIHGSFKDTTGTNITYSIVMVRTHLIV